MNTTSKNELRQKYRALRDSFGEEFIEKASQTVCKSLAKREEFINADTVLLYYPIKNEISPMPLFEICLKMGKKVAFPVCQNDTLSLVFKAVSSIDELSRSAFGLFEPNEGCETVELTQNTLCVVPALAFARDGHRLGYGKGFYDRFLANFHGTSVGLSYSALLLCEILHEKHDIPLDMIITESEVLRIAQKN